jgi:toxin ParE1/3/4
MAKVTWLPEALGDVERLYIWLKNIDDQAATKATSCILRGAALLKTSPRIGRPMPDETGRRELFVAFGAGAYVLRYMLEDSGTVVVIRVWHSRENR